ncbi:MAG: lipid-A-disaccharide synthase-related protein [Geitlerinemataceae cyanobacterium]
MLSTIPPTLLCLSNGHGEDAIAVAILRQIQAIAPDIELLALPIVGEGRAYSKLPGVAIAGHVKAMPSGGFNYMNGREFWRDVRGGLLGLTWAQIATTRSWAKRGAVVLAAGDIVPLAMARLSGADFAFVGTAKSEYYLRDEIGPIPRPGISDAIERLSGSVYLPWERWLLSSKRCRAIFPRDSLTAKVLNKFNLPAYDLGNPMMDELEPSERCRNAIESRSLTVLLLPGSRSPEAANNWEVILRAVPPIREAFADRAVTFVAAIAPGLNLDDFALPLERYGWRPVRDVPDWLDDARARCFSLARAQLVLSQHAYADCLHRSDIALAMAGTATEQFVGLGKPAIVFPGAGPQFTPAFAEAQARLLGSSLIRLPRPEVAVDTVVRLLKSPDWLQNIADNGRRRMGDAGAARRIAECVADRLFDKQVNER